MWKKVSAFSLAVMGRLDTVTNDRFQVSEFNDSFPAMNLKRRRSFGDPFLLVAFLQIGQPGKFRFCGDPAFWEFVLSCG
jgi:hypothetical protein